jgi:hypothetical protein
MKIYITCLAYFLVFSLAGPLCAESLLEEQAQPVCGDIELIRGIKSIDLSLNHQSITSLDASIDKTILLGVLRNPRLQLVHIFFPSNETNPERALDWPIRRMSLKILEYKLTSNSIVYVIGTASRPGREDVQQYLARARVASVMDFMRTNFVNLPRAFAGASAPSERFQLTASDARFLNIEPQAFRNDPVSLNNSVFVFVFPCGSFIEGDLPRYPGEIAFPYSLVQSVFSIKIEYPQYCCTHPGVLGPYRNENVPEGKPCFGTDSLGNRREGRACYSDYQPIQPSLLREDRLAKLVSYAQMGEASYKARPYADLIPVSAVQSLMNEARQEIFEALGPEAQAARSYFTNQFDWLREILEDVQGPFVRGAEATKIHGVIRGIVELAQEALSAATDGRLTVDLCASVEPKNATVSLIPLGGAESGQNRLVPGVSARFWRGLYSYRVKVGGIDRITCPQQVKGSEDGCAALDLWNHPLPVLHCDVLSGKCQQLGHESLEECRSHRTVPNVPIGENPRSPAGEWQERSAQLSALLEQRLPKVLKDFSAIRNHLQREEPGATYTVGGTNRALSTVQSSLESALVEPELAALRDHMALLFLTARSDLRIGGAQVTTGPRVISILASRSPLITEAPARIAKDRAESWFDRIDTLAQKILESARKKTISTKLCVVSRPAGAKFLMHPPSRPERLFETGTAGELPAYRGVYAYELSLKGFRTLKCQPLPGELRSDCAFLDLWDDPRPVLDCDLSRGDCRRRERAASACQDER